MISFKEAIKFTIRNKDVHREMFLKKIFKNLKNSFSILIIIPIPFWWPLTSSIGSRYYLNPFSDIPHSTNNNKILTDEASIAQFFCGSLGVLPHNRLP
jgi:hypothetical protein